MEKKNQTRASQTSKSDSTKVEARAKEVKVKEKPKVWTHTSHNVPTPT